MNCSIGLHCLLNYITIHNTLQLHFDISNCTLVHLTHTCIRLNCMLKNSFQLLNCSGTVTQLTAPFKSFFSPSLFNNIIAYFLVFLLCFCNIVQSYNTRYATEVLYDLPPPFCFNLFPSQEGKKRIWRVPHPIPTRAPGRPPWNII